MRGRKRRTLFAATIASAALLYASAIPAVAGASGSSSSTPTVSAPNSGLGGYVAMDSPVTEISAEWRIPTLGTERPGEAATWIGAQGSANAPFIQLGSTEFADEDGAGAVKASYHLFWSDPAQALEAVNIATLKHPGDLITFTMTQDSAGWDLVVRDHLSGFTRSTQVDYAPGGTYAVGEWYQEDPASALVTTIDEPYPDISTVTLQNLQVNGEVPHLTLNDASVLSTQNGANLVPTPVRHGAFSMVPAKGAAEQYLADAVPVNTATFSVSELLQGVIDPSPTEERTLVLAEAKALQRFADQIATQKWPAADRASVARLVQDSRSLDTQVNQWIASNGSTASLGQVLTGSKLGADASALRAHLKLPPASS
jgi:Peptidase A4 family